MRIQVKQPSNCVEEKERVEPFVKANESLRELPLPVRVLSPGSRSRALQGVVENGLRVG